MEDDEHQLNEEPVVFLEEADEIADAALIAEAEADFAAGRCIPHEEVAAWLDTWGKGERVPPPKSWFK